MSILLADRLRGILLGGAVGDALGAPVEFMKRSEILLNFGKRGITEFAPAYGRIGAITDDTQMTLFTLEGLMRAKVRADSRGICHPPSVIDAAYQRWLATQEGERPSEELSGWLVQQPQLWSRRAPGLTCLSALSEKGGRFGLEAKNQSKGAGCIMPGDELHPPGEPTPWPEKVPLWAPHRTTVTLPPASGTRRCQAGPPPRRRETAPPRRRR